MHRVASATGTRAWLITGPCVFFAWIERRGIGELADIEPLHVATYIDAYQMIRRRTAEAGFKIKLGCHVFRTTGITAYLGAGDKFENAQAMAAHESPRTTKL